jgi:hypothetical protein
VPKKEEKFILEKFNSPPGNDWEYSSSASQTKFKARYLLEKNTNTRKVII